MLAISTKCGTSGRLALSKAEKEEIQNQVGSELQLFWLPAKARACEDRAFASNELTISIFALGIAFSSLAKPFFDAIAQEVAKDVWNGLKKLSGLLWGKMQKKSYQANGQMLIYFELNDEHVAVQLFPPEGGTMEEIQNHIEEELRQLALDWERIQEDIQRFSIGRDDGLDSFVTHQGSGWKVHVISKIGDHYAISHCDNVFLGELEF